MVGPLDGSCCFLVTRMDAQLCRDVTHAQQDEVQIEENNLPSSLLMARFTFHV